MPRHSLSNSQDEPTEINLSPMIDCIFILLIFFIVTTVFVEEPGVDINKPQAATAQRLEKNSILIAVTADNKVVYGGKEVGISGVGARIKPLLIKNNLPVIILADQQADQGVFSRLLGEVKLAGAEKISFSTEP
jgi:biopolymer transport protein ExbD